MLLDNKHITGLLCSLVFCMPLFSTQKPHLYILIHGTWSAPRHSLLHGGGPQWYQAGHTTFDTLKRATNAHIIHHTWSGKNNLADRLEGAKTLISLIQKHATTHTIHIIAHSHGGNVALLALDTLIKDNPTTKIATLVLLGTPIYFEWYPASVTAVGTIYNIFSYGDIVQPVAGMYERELPEQPHIFNIQLKINNSCPMHNQLYKPELIEQIPHFSKLFGKKDVYCLHCTTGKKPVITHDTNRAEDIRTDKRFTQQLQASWTEIRDKHAQKNTANHDRLTRFRDRWTQYYQRTIARLYSAINTNQA